MLAQWASDCVERVLPLFEERHPEDDRPRKAVEAKRSCGVHAHGLPAAWRSETHSRSRGRCSA